MSVICIISREDEILFNLDYPFVQWFQVHSCSSPIPNPGFMILTHWHALGGRDTGLSDSGSGECVVCSCQWNWFVTTDRTGEGWARAGWVRVLTEWDNQSGKGRSQKSVEYWKHEMFATTQMLDLVSRYLQCSASVSLRCGKLNYKLKLVSQHVPNTDSLTLKISVPIHFWCRKNVFVSVSRTSARIG